MVHLSGLEVKSETSPEGTIEIQQIGLRPGEKLYEELLIGSNVEGTDHPLIMRAQEAEIPWPLLQDLLKKMEVACEQFDYETVRKLLLHMVPGYTPQCGIEDFIWRTQNQGEAVSTVDFTSN
jgi:FlaA1/EpsC-like NDP-sugar epimerase